MGPLQTKVLLSFVFSLQHRFSEKAILPQTWAYGKAYFDKSTKYHCSQFVRVTFLSALFRFDPNSSKNRIDFAQQICRWGLFNIHRGIVRWCVVPIFLVRSVNYVNPKYVGLWGLCVVRMWKLDEHKIQSENFRQNIDFTLKEKGYYESISWCHLIISKMVLWGVGRVGWAKKITLKKSQVSGGWGRGYKKSLIKCEMLCLKLTKCIRQKGPPFYSQEDPKCGTCLKTSFPGTRTLHLLDNWY